jgi:hypothetical protein
MSDVATYALISGLGDIVTLTDFNNFQYNAGALISEFLSAEDTLLAKFITKPFLSDTVILTDAVYKALRATLTDSILTTDLLLVVQGVTLVEQFLLQDVPNAAAVYSQTIAEALLTDDNLLWFWGKFVVENFALTDSISRQYQGVVNPADTLAITDAMVDWMVYALSGTELAVMTDIITPQMIFKGEALVDNICLTATYVSPSGNITTWVVNTRTSAVTEYRNYNFNSFAKMGMRFLGANAQGLWVLDVELDDTQSIITKMKSGLMQLAGSRFTSFKGAYLGIRVKDASGTRFHPKGDFILKLYAGDGREYIYAFRPQNMQTTKINMGKGLRARYFAWELIAPGENFDLESVEFVPITSIRRV